MSKGKAAGGKTRVLFVDETNDLQSQIAEYFLLERYGDLYEAYSAGPNHDCIDCDLLSVMYREGLDIRRNISKDFASESVPAEVDYIVFLEKATHDRVKDAVPWDAPHILKDFGRKDGFADAEDAAAQYQSYKDLIGRVAAWVDEAFADPGKLGELVVR
ncbi:MAG: hypothetical protein GX224_00980 [Thermoplasmatales archaeon]|nr:hypothetical protein [Thermoplasmatales archaeon]